MNMTLFRIGVLEYEFIDGNISIHIPSDAILTKNNIDLSLLLFNQFRTNFYPEFNECNIYCDSWLLSPKLSKYLKFDSRILLFQLYFEILEEDNNALDIFEWVFKVNHTHEIDDLPEETSLQVNLKKALQNGEKIGKALGILKKK